MRLQTVQNDIKHQFGMLSSISNLVDKADLISHLSMKFFYFLLNVTYLWKQSGGYPRFRSGAKTNLKLIILFFINLRG